MKKIFLTLTTATLLSVRTMAFADATTDIKVEVNQQPLQFNQPPVIMDGTTLVPLRAILEALGAKVDWDPSSQTVIATKGDTVIKLTIGQMLAQRNKDKISLSVASTIINGSTMVPARFIAESFGETVDWIEATRTVSIVEPIGKTPQEPTNNNAGSNTVPAQNTQPPMTVDVYTLEDQFIHAINIHLDSHTATGIVPILPQGYTYDVSYSGFDTNGNNISVSNDQFISGQSFSFNYGASGTLKIKVKATGQTALTGKTIYSIPGNQITRY